MDEVDDHPGLLARVAAGHPADTLLVDAPRGRRREVHADRRSRGVPSLGQQLRVDEHIDVAALVGGEDRGQLALRRLAGDGARLDALGPQRLGHVVGVLDPRGVQDARHAAEARLVEVRDREVERRLIEQLGQQLLVELDVDLALAQRHLGDRADPDPGRDADAAQRRDDATPGGLREVEAGGLRREQVGDVAGDERARRGHADEDGAGPLADRRAGLLAEGRVRLVADDHGVDRGDPARVAHEPLVGLDGHWAIGAQVVLGTEQRRGDPVAVAPRRQLAVELVDEVAAVREDEDPAGPRGLHEAHRGHGLAGTGGVLEPEALARVGVVDATVDDVLVQVWVGVVVLVGIRLVLVLGVLLLRGGRGRLLVVLVLLRLLRRGGRDLLAVLAVVVLLVVLVVLLVRLLRRLLHARRGALGVGDRGVGRGLVDRQHRRGGGCGDRAAVALLASEQGRQRARERVDLMGVQRRPVREHDLLLGEHALQAQHQRVAAPPFGRRHAEPVGQLGQDAVERPAAGAAGGERLGGLLPGVQEGLTREALGLSDLLRSGKGGGYRHARGLGHEALAMHGQGGNGFRPARNPGTPGTAGEGTSQ